MSPAEEVSPSIKLRPHHFESLLCTLCLSLEEQARTEMFNSATALGEETALRIHEAFEDILSQPDDAEIEVVSALDDICKLCPKNHKQSCKIEDRSVEYLVSAQFGIKPGDVLRLGDLRPKLQKFYSEYDAPWKDENWNKRVKKYPHLAEQNKENYWLYKLRGE